MATLGWNLTQSTDVSKREGDKDSLFFEEGVPDPDARVFVVSFNQRNRLRLIDAPDLLPFVEEAVNQYWPKGVEERNEMNGCMELKLKGNPWYPIGADAVHSKLLLCKVVANFRSIGYKLYASIDLSYGTEGQDLETWAFRKIWSDLQYVPTACESCGQFSQDPDYLKEDEVDLGLPTPLPIDSDSE
ncbi:unnamed protein product [Orchesella dallaii]|uniref:Uncharacterized protein n=1 Tax=Orchesella dallaii TaxID=48710 RepID=A0ABP1RFA7_9HEXA